MIIRNLEAGDEEAVYELMCELENDILDRSRFHRAYLDYLEDGQMHCLAAEEAQTVIGVLNLRIGTMLCRTGKIAEIVELSVRDGMRSKGIGRKLFERALQIAEEAGCVRLEVSSNMTRQGAHRFYEREGMERSHYKFVRYL